MSSTQRGNRTGNAGRPNQGAMGFMNPERLAPLLPKYANKIGKTIERVSIHYAEEGVTVEVDSLLDSTGDKVVESETVSFAEFHRRMGVANAPSDDERLRSLKRKYELRLNVEFPTPGPRSGAEADVQSWLDTLPFAQRRALLMSQKAFDKAYPEGFRA